MWLSPQGRTHTSTNTLLELSGNSSSCPEQQRQEAVHLFATCFIIIHIRVVIKGKALVKYAHREHGSSTHREHGSSTRCQQLYIHWG